MAEFTNSTDPNTDYEDLIMADVRPGNIPLTDRFTSEHDNRDLMAKAGISSTVVRDNVVFIQNLLTYYHPGDVPDTTNSYRDFEKISRIQNILQNQFDLGGRWKQKTVVAAVEKVTDSAARKNVVDSEIDARMARTANDRHCGCLCSRRCQRYRDRSLCGI